MRQPGRRCLLCCSLFTFDYEKKRGLETAALQPRRNRAVRTPRDVSMCFENDWGASTSELPPGPATFPVRKCRRRIAPPTQVAREKEKNSREMYQLFFSEKSAAAHHSSRPAGRRGQLPPRLISRERRKKLAGNVSIVFPKKSRRARA